MQVSEKKSPIVDGVPHPDAIAAAVAALTQHATIHTARFDQMVISKLNVRQKKTDVTELKALMLAQGMLQNLIGYEQTIDGKPTGIIEIVAGGRRLTAAGMLINEGLWPVDFQLHYLLVTQDEAIEISLTENLGRENMHPADMFVAMQEMVKRGRALDDIALRFKLDVLTVKRRLKLANVSPRLLDLYRNDQADFNQMMALAITDDHAAQEQAWDSLSKYNRSAHDLRRLLTAQQINIQTDRVARYVGMEAYEKAGGIVTRDLFSDSGAGYISDVALLEHLALAKLEKQRAKLTKEGIAWTEIILRADHATLADYATVRTSLTELTTEQTSQLATLEARLKQLEEQIEELDGDDEDEAFAPLEAEHTEVTAQRRAILNSRKSVAHEGDRALAGAVLMLDSAGALVVKRDLVRPADKAKMAALPSAPGTGAAPVRRAKATHSDRLTHELTSHRTAALQAEMMAQGDVALVYVTYTLMRRVLLRYGSGPLAHINVTEPDLADTAKSSDAAQAFVTRRKQLVERLPSNNEGGGLLAWLSGQPHAVVMEMLAFCVASSLDATQQREGASPEYVQLAQALNLDMSKWWKPTAADYFNHVSKEHIMAVVKQAASPEAAVPLEKMKKAAAAEAAARAVAGMSWLPELLRADS